MNKVEIEELLCYGERVDLECKKAENSVPKSVWETYSSFANTNGGVILLGIEENVQESDLENRFSVYGVQDPLKIVRDFWNTINGEKVNKNILVDANVGTVEFDGKTVVWIQVPAANYKQRPIYINGNPLKGTYKRTYEGDYHCTDEEIKAMLRDASDTGNDGGILDGYDMEDIDTEALKAYRIRFELQNPDHVFNGYEDKEFLHHMGGYSFDRSTKKEGLTAAGLLMFGKGLPIRERFDNIRLDYIDKTNLQISSRWSDRLTYDGMWENNLFNFFSRVIPKLVSDVKKPFVMNGMVRIDDTPVHKAIREAVVNMMIHSDYFITGVLKIEKQNNGFVFSNPGNLKLPVSSIYDGNHSVARNPRIQTMFRMIGLGDNIGSGFPTILSAWGEENWRKPDLRENPELRQVELSLLMISLMPPECSEYLYSLMGRAYEDLKKDEQIILATAYLEKNVSNVRLQTILNLHAAEIGKYLSGLVEREMLIANLNGRWTTYSINHEYHQKSYQVRMEDLFDQQTKLIHSDKNIYEYVCANGFITAKQVLEITSIKTQQGASAALRRLIKNGLLMKERYGNQVIYKKK